MVLRGARHFAFLGRSGLDKSTARDLIQDLETLGAECVVIKGDVCNPKDAMRLIAATERDIGGVVQASMGLKESLFSDMSNESWHIGIDPKVQGTWNLYNSLQTTGRHLGLDFFLLTSSVSGSVGTATESNYCSANHFLDHFARYLRSQGIPGVSIGLGMISEVGYLHDNPEIEALLLRKGIQALDSDELLQIIDLALSSSLTASTHDDYDLLANAHLLTGMEASGLKRLRKMGFDGTNVAWDDPRASLLANALDGQQLTQSPSHSGKLPAGVMKELDQGKTLAESVLDCIRRRFGNLVLMKYEDVDAKKPLADYGMDSMIAAEFRTWFYQNMKVDIPMLVLLDKISNLETLRDTSLSQLE
ncbi:KR domain-containing protein [Annulohypoxylon truncatum]|uniref:KR domain-containing protein n=1 Tax=Annulohypoxylon truncatum TaxID=327061 RepID=UPI0020084439|nr:KR domain-containing protein [Annulohypoxylon truncatum]KAI1213169.1 KR domain-containing protein [Annulohypoxylon truncatum]